MAAFSVLVTTDAGKELIAKVIAKGSSMEFTNLRTSDTEYTLEELEDLTELSGIKQTVVPDRVSRPGATTVQAEATVTNETVTSGYYIHTIGLYAADLDEGEILYAAAIETSGGIYIPPYGGAAVSGVYIKLISTITNTLDVSLYIDPAGSVTMGQFQDAVNTLDQKIDEETAERETGDSETLSEARTYTDVSIADAILRAFPLIDEFKDIIFDGVVTIGAQIPASGTYAVLAVNTDPETSGDYPYLVSKYTDGTQVGDSAKAKPREGVNSYFTPSGEVQQLQEFYIIELGGGSWQMLGVDLTNYYTKMETDALIDAKVSTDNGDISDTMINTFTASAADYPIPAAGDSTKTAFGKVRKFIQDFNNFKTGIITLGQLVNNGTTTEEGFALDARYGKTLADGLTQLNTDLNTVEGKLNYVNTYYATLLGSQSNVVVSSSENYVPILIYGLMNSSQTLCGVVFLNNNLQTVNVSSFGPGSITASYNNGTAVIPLGPYSQAVLLTPTPISLSLT